MKFQQKALTASAAVLLLLISMIAMSGCGAGRMMIIQPTESKMRVSSVYIGEANSPISVPNDVKSAFQKKAEELLYGEGGFQQGKELNIRYRFIQFDPGNQFTRWFWGGIGNAGEGSLTVEAKYFDSTNKELATVHSEGRIGSGAFGGSFDYAVEKAAEKIAEFTRTNFR
jgi:hypothetical protein